MRASQTMQARILSDAVGPFPKMFTCMLWIPKGFCLESDRTRIPRNFLLNSICDGALCEQDLRGLAPTAWAVMFLLPTLRHPCPLDSQSQTPGKRAEAAGTGRGPGRAPDCLAILVASAEHIRRRNMGSRYAGERGMPYELRPSAWPAGLCCCSVFGSMRRRTLARLRGLCESRPSKLQIWASPKKSAKTFLTSHIFFRILSFRSSFCMQLAQSSFTCCGPAPPIQCLLRSSFDTYQQRPPRQSETAGAAANCPYRP